jgi:hypothetical protein
MPPKLTKAGERSEAEAIPPILVTKDDSPATPQGRSEIVGVDSTLSIPFAAQRGSQLVARAYIIYSTDAGETLLGVRAIPSATW